MDPDTKTDIGGIKLIDKAALHRGPLSRSAMFFEKFCDIKAYYGQYPKNCPTMAPPALKRRKLSHSLNGDDRRLAQSPLVDTPGTSDADNIPSNASNADMGSVATSSQADEDEEMDEDDAYNHDEEEGFAEEEDGLEDEEQSKSAPEKVEKAKPSNGHQHSQRNNGFQGGGYTGEVYKSNLFKLQVDELLQRVRPRHGKKEAHAEDALRTLKAIIERIPDREPQAVSAFGFA